MLRSRFKDDSRYEIGIDEAGRGCLWGPLMAGAVSWKAEAEWDDTVRELSSKIKDSKKVSPKKRGELAEKIKAAATGWGIGIVSAKEVDSLGATRANQLAFRRAIEAMSAGCDGDNISSQIRLCIDGILPVHTVLENEVCETIIEGDATYLSIAAASILAKVAHDEWVTDYCSKNIEVATQYDLTSCKGYGTAKHRAGLLKYGPSEHHRRLYLRKLLPHLGYSRCQIGEEKDEDGDKELI